MAVYLVSYDLSSPKRNYNDLYKRLESYDEWAHIMQSTWCIETTRSATDVRDHLKKVIDADDHLIVVEFGASWASWLNSDMNDWIKKLS